MDELLGHGSELVDTRIPLDFSENVSAVEFSVAYGTKENGKENYWKKLQTRSLLQWW